MANEGAGSGADASGAGAAGGAGAADAAAGAGGNGTQGGATGAQGGADASKGADYWSGEAKAAFAKRDAEATQRKAAEGERDALKARVAELEKAAPQGQSGAQASGAGTGAAAPTFDPKVAEAAGSTAAKAEMAAWRAEQNRIKLEDTVAIAYKAVGGLDQDYLSFKVDQAVKEGKLTVDATGRVQGHEAFITGLRTTQPHLFGKPPEGAIPGGAGSAVMNDLRKANPDGRRGSLAQGPVWKPEQRRAAEEASRKK